MSEFLIWCWSCGFRLVQVVYLCDHYQCIQIGSVVYNTKRLLYGASQGSVVGPILFSLYTIRLSKVIQNHPSICFPFYTDDMQLYVHLTHKHVTEAFDMLKNCLDNVKKWLSANKHNLNPDKTEFNILFGSRTVHKKLSEVFQINIIVISFHLLR